MIPIYKVWEAITEKLPTALQESYDNCGLQVGDPSQPATGVLCCVDITEAVLHEAIAKGCNVIVAHHPLLFKGLKQVGTSSYNRQNEASGTKGTKRTKPKLLRRNEAYA